MPIIQTVQGIRFPALDDETILDASIRNGTPLSHGCRSGQCGSCKGKVIHGESVPLDDESGLSDAEHSAGWILTCMRVARTDLILEAESVTDDVLPESKIVACRIHSIDQLAEDVVRVVLRLPPAVSFPYLPGQYVHVIANNGMRRSYSMANATAENQRLEFHIRAVPGGAMSAYWFGQAKVNDLLRLNGPLGGFYLRPVADLDLVFLATGTGIAPVKAMLEALGNALPEARPRSVSVYWGGRTLADLYWDVSTLGSWFRYIPVLSRGHDAWTGARGHVQQVLLAERSDLSQVVVYACGSLGMIREADAALSKAGLPHQHFFSDAFVSSAAG
ncbi:MAG: 2Fe-2S iron-sulfur cluster binding domain-containing protein [Magnetococcales bacterium]|nr:2Fe-2S iron-sulfur cluster binding domain-containing protein [Magnetococcales bacterium]